MDDADLLSVQNHDLALHGNLREEQQKNANEEFYVCHANMSEKLATRGLHWPPAPLSCSSFGRQHQEQPNNQRMLQQHPYHPSDH